MTQRPDDPRVTTYVFGEMPANERAAFESELEHSAELRAEVDATRRVIEAIEGQYAGETIATMSDEERALLQTQVAAGEKVVPAKNPAPRRSGAAITVGALALVGVLLIGVVIAIPAFQASREASRRVTYNDAATEPLSTLRAYPESIEEDDALVRDSSVDSSTAAMGDLSEMYEAPVEESTISRGLDVSGPAAPTHEAAKRKIAPDVAGVSDSRPGRESRPRDRGEPTGKSDPKPTVVDQTTPTTAPSNAPTLKKYAAPSAQPTPSPIPTSEDAPALVETLSKTDVSSRGKQAQVSRQLKDDGLRLSESRSKFTNPVSSRGTEKTERELLEEEEADAGHGPGRGGDRYAVINDNPFVTVTNQPLSTFSIDVDTASYSKVRMYLLQQNSLPRPDAVRIEELVNYFNYDYAPPASDDEHPFSAAMEVTTCPWNTKHRLARIGIKGKVIEDQRPASNLVFLLDVSGSMNQPNKLPLMVEGMKMLVNQLTENDQVAIVVYAGAAGVVLDSTQGDKKQVILDALERLRAGGSTNGGQGIKLAYQMARDYFIQGGTNRVILCTDGDFNVGVTGTDELVRLAEENAKTNIFLSVLGFGMGNHNDAMMEEISNKGNGNYAFVDSKKEAHKVLVEQMGGTLVTIAKDVKIQIEFNPIEVVAYRLIGYENRILAAQDFNDDTKDAGEIGAGHTITALYELVPPDGKDDLNVPPVDPLKYQKDESPTDAAKTGELLTLKLRYKQPEGDTSTLMTYSVRDEEKRFGEADQDFRFAAAVASFGMLLRNSPHKGESNFAAVEEIATEAASGDATGYRTEFLQMVAKAKALTGE